MRGSSEQQIGGLTGLRGFAALWVAVLHLYAGPKDSLLGKIASTGAWGVAVFFVLSGFILAYVYHSRFADGSIGYFQFLKYRLARIYPLHVFMLMLVLLLIVAGLYMRQPNDTLNAFMLNVFLLHGWGFIDKLTWNQASWSISHEFFCYLLFPAIAVALRRQSLIAVVSFVIIAVAMIYWHPWLRFLNWLDVAVPPGVQMANGYSLMQWSYLFIFGVSWFYFTTKLPRLPSAVLDSLVVLSVGYMFWELTRAEPFGWLNIAMPSALIVFVLKEQRSKLGDLIFANPVAVWLGDISYALYLSHVPVTEAIIGYFSYYKTDTPLLVKIIICCSFATLLHWWVEIPARRWIRALPVGPVSGKA